MGYLGIFQSDYLDSWVTQAKISFGARTFIFKFIQNIEYDVFSVADIDSLEEGGLIYGFVLICL